MIGLKRKKYISRFVVIKGLFVTLDDNEKTDTHTHTHTIRKSGFESPRKHILPMAEVTQKFYKRLLKVSFRKGNIKSVFRRKARNDFGKVSLKK